MKNKRIRIRERFSVIWMYTKYQIITKMFLVFILFPLYSWIIRILMESVGRVNVSSGDYIKFLLSYQGFGMLVVTLILLIILTGIDINAFIIMGALVKEGKIKISAKSMIYVSIKSVRRLIQPSGILLMIYIALVIPLIGLGVTISPMKNFQMPNFIKSVIFDNLFYSVLYHILLGVLIFISIKYAFVFHYMIILNLKIREALKRASELMKNNWIKFVRDFILRLFIYLMILLFLFGSAIGEMLLSINTFVENIFISRFLTLFTILIIFEITSFVTLMTVPVITYRLTDLFYKYNEINGENVSIDIDEDKYKLQNENRISVIKSTISKRLIFLIILVFNFIMSIYFSIFFNDIFKPERKIEIVAHRGGGDLGAENTIEGMKQAIKAGAKWSEIDVQRTKDGYYIINHDSTFKRVARDSRKASNMTLKEIKEIKVRDLFDSSRASQEVATLEEFMDASKGKIGLYIELKGKTADYKMVDDVVRIIKAKGMIKETAILSLDYNLIKYTENNYPEITTGYLYFFSFGKTEQLIGDILIMEESQATENKIESIKNAGKKAVVWTVNTKESIEYFVNSKVDGIITDYVKKVKTGMEERNNRTDVDSIIYFFFKE
ncbi:MAG: glycerophosphoryl diester phosphodiesterase membrane domain-containing protein [Tissierellia bacterium]|nr:glycerophosphoryl diester phosphodiesterase membrane domain-containing protein [Tissierellia bacterium]